MNWKGFQNPPDEAKPKVGHTDDSHVKEFLMPNAPNTPPTRLGSGEEFGPEGQLTVKAAAELLRRGVEIAASPTGEREGLIRATLADIGTLNAGSGEAGDRPHYDHRGEPEIFAGDSDYSADAMDKMAPIDHVVWASTALDDISGCSDCDDGKCEECKGRFNKAMAHLSRYAEKVGELAGDDGERDDSPLGESGAKVLKTFDETHTADLEAAAVSIAKHTVQPGASHFGGFPKRK
jgi:hypothetical protein